MKFPIGAFRPDQPITAPGRSPYVSGVQPIQDSEFGIAYAPMPQFLTVAGAAALDAAPRGGLSIQLAAGTRKLFMFTATTFEEAASDFTWTERANTLSVTTGFDWSMVKFGDYLIATNSTAGPYAYNLETPAGFNAISGAPSTLIDVWVDANRVCGIYAGNVACSAFNDHTTWNANGADAQPVNDGGAMIKGVRLSNNRSIVFQANAIRHMDFVGPGGALGPAFDLHTIVDGEGVGSVGARSVVPFLGSVAYLSASGFNLLGNDTSIRQIGAEKVNRWFLDNIETGSENLVQGCADPQNKMIWWRYRANGVSSTTVSENMIGWDWQLDEFVLAEEQTSFLVPTAQPAYHADNVDALFANADADLPTMDSDFWAGSAPQFGGLDGSYKVGYFNGSNMAAEVHMAPAVLPRSQYINDVTPLTDAENGTVAIAARENAQGTMSFGSSSSIDDDGVARVLERGKVIQGKIAIPAGESWTYIRGADYVNAGAP